MFSGADRSELAASPDGVPSPPHDDGNEDDLPQCKIKRNYSCSLCSFFSQNPRTFLYHTRDVHNDKIKIYECSKCLYASKHSQKLQRHINMIHVPGKVDRPRKEVSKKAVAQKVEVKEEVLITPLMDMDEIIEGREEAEQEAAAQVKCSVCSFTSKSAALMRRHERVVHLKKRFLRCTKCSYVTHVKARFTKHVKYHSMPMIKCDLCDFRTPYKWNLDRHYKNHCGSGAFQCSKCNFRADIKQSLTVHEMNHHVPPVGAGAAVLMRKRNKVGASETNAFESDGIEQEELELLRLERENEDGMLGTESDGEEPDLNADLGSKLQTALERPMVAKKSMNKGITGYPQQQHHPLKKHKCSVCYYRATYPHEVARHEKRIHGIIRDKRPPPNLIPIQGKPISPVFSATENRLQSDEPTPPVNEKEFNEMCKKSSLTSSFKEFVSLIDDEDALKSIPDSNEDADELETDGDMLNESLDDGTLKQSQTDLLKKKNASFFNKIKEKLANNNEDDNLACTTCGFVANTADEATAHEQIHNHREEVPVPESELSSTRCQHCRQRCKTSADLVNHLKVCQVYNSTLLSRYNTMNGEEALDSPGENRVFVWNDLPSPVNDEDDEYDMYDSEPPVECVVELSEPPPRLAPGPRTTPQSEVRRPAPQGPSMKKVFKCPHCSFWASTASRFHVHIVGHLNKKPFECSLCSYRSNWRWDITKHIRLKSARDPGHAAATVNMTDETGRRNYSKYNKYLTMMKVSEPTADSSGSGKRTRACEATQGTVGVDDILQPIPAPPQLTPAPIAGVAASSSLQATPRPPPPLQAAHSVGSSKRTLWKCKKCLYRNSDKDKVLEHVKSHYDHGVEENEEFYDEEDDIHGSQSVASNGYKCGHCQHISRWRYVVQRHCRLVHDGDEKIEVANDNDKNLPSLDGVNSSRDEKKGFFSCDVCPFSSENAGDLTAHKLNHVDRPGSIFKCSYCPFFVPSKIAVLEHMEIHGMDGADMGPKLTVESFDPGECVDRVKGEDNDGIKRYHCRQCPYVSNSKTQFLYHKQFHRPRDSPFKCMYCSYNVSRRHLLHQHLRVHHSYKTADNAEETDDELPDIPLVWVKRGGAFLKMYKCRWCPHVNQRRINIQEHEKMHQDSFKLQCHHCSYTCNNPGVLSCHIKVHSGFYGKIQSLVDPTRPDSEQIRFLRDSEEITTLQNDKQIQLEKHSSAEPQVSVKEANPEPSTPESSYYQTSTYDEENVALDDFSQTYISFCNKCPARFLHGKEFKIHAKFHLIRLPFKCDYCSYTARQRPHLLAHLKVHSQEYQERTAALVDSYMVSPEHQQPKKTLINGGSSAFNGPVWSVISIPKPKSSSQNNKGNKPQAKHSCHKCPAKFFKPVALQYHLSLHGGTHLHRCKYCDYTVKTYGNLIKHQLIHENKSKKGSENFFAKSEADDKSASPKKTDPLFGEQMHGSPNFVYPMYLKNGRLKEKRYKCHKCPSAFEKRDQYRVHLTLHGSKQKYKCQKCDYSVKYSANFIQHMKKHQHNDDARLAIDSPIKDESDVESSALPGPLPLTMLEKQTLVIERKRSIIKDEERKAYYCYLCPYSNQRRDCLENHQRRHFSISGMRNAFQCLHCDYSATQANFLREHSKLHMKPVSRYLPEAFLKAELIELWGKDEDAPEETSEIIFKDNGENQYLPHLPEDTETDNDKENDCKIFINPITGEVIGEDNDGSSVLEEDEVYPSGSNCAPVGTVEEWQLNGEDLIEMVEELTDKAKIKKPRGKNWQCELCPHAFGKRELWERHFNLHGSNQRYSCDVCDYSVKYYTNYVQHMRMHQSHEPHKLIRIKQYVPLDENSMQINVNLTDDGDVGIKYHSGEKDDSEEMDEMEVEEDAAAEQSSDKHL